MKVCFFGSYTKDPQVRLFIKKVELLNIEIVECQEDVNLSLENKNIRSIIKSFFSLYKKHKGLEYDIVVLPLWWGAIQILLLKLISKKPILYFGQGSPYDELVNDRKKISSTSLTAKFFYYFEKIVCRFSDLIIKESEAEIEYYTKQMRINPKKFRPLFLSADESKFPVCSYKENSDKFVIMFWGTFIPLHGIEVIIRAAKILSSHNDIIFRFCGEGQTKKEIESYAKENQLNNVGFLGFVEHSSLIDNIKKSDICLGIFGKSEKASIVVTHKVFQVLCSQKPLITMDSKPVREINLINKQNCVLVKKQDPEALAKAILYLKNDNVQRKKIALQGRKLFEEKLSMMQSALLLSKYFEQILKTK